MQMTKETMYGCSNQSKESSMQIHAEQSTNFKLENTQQLLEFHALRDHQT